MTVAPTFLFCLGATKAGTSWLYRYLSRHPECYLRSIKELHYFDTVENGHYDRPILGQRKRLAALQTAEGRPAMVARMRRDIVEWLEVLEQRREDTAAYPEYLTAHRGDRHLVADMTPSYALLPERRLQAMAAMDPDVRFVYLLRDPVSRLWSDVRMMARRKTDDLAAFAASANERMHRALAAIEAGQSGRSDYAAAITRLGKAVDPPRLLVMFLDEMMTPNGLSRLCAFLGIAARPGDFDQPIHEGAPLDMDDALRERAVRPCVRNMNLSPAMFSDVPESWRRNMGEGVA